MATEIERKFLISDATWRNQTHASRHYEQGYLCGRGPASIRARIDGDSARLNIKAAEIGTTRAEYDYEIPLADARHMIDHMCVASPVKKIRYWVEHAGHIWEIDEFAGDNAPLIVAEIELDDADEAFDKPDWLGTEVTDDERYYNHALALAPYATWR
ncbi:CYTH domain-containing protein [Salinisphaera sp. USBA-960]|uniref:CYTH domain-containing protein n=1 Tax=Salinisphaera orenii TaxID=856731 RepID=UPI000DBE078E|nr:CYTH domain-containing protein [Salifodinibacter halophilus]NNC25886.1 CYTH domain-containing protein [Salifodinibacter halophilus]